jgi:hypothetical protein
MSGSTGNVYKYHELSLKIYNDYVKNKNHIIVGWDNNFKVLSDTEYLNICNNRKGFGGTYTSAIGSYLTNLNTTNDLEIIILTDGQVDTNDISRCDNYVSKLKLNISSVKSYISAYSANCSVLAPFLRGSWSAEVFHDNQSLQFNQMKCIYSLNQLERQKLMEIVKTATTEDEINNIFDKLFDMITSMTMGKTSGDANLRNDILIMANRIKQNVKSKLSKSYQLELFENELKNNKSVSIDIMINLVNYYNKSFNGSTFQNKINSLLQLCDGKLSHLFDPSQIRAQALERVTTTTSNVSNDELEKINNMDTQIKPVECPIMLDSTPNVVLLIKQGIPIFDQIEKKTQDSIMLNTFYAHNCRELIKQRLDHFMSLEAYIGLETIKSPMTNSPLVGCLVLGSDDLSVKATNHAIGQMVLGKSGVIGNPDIWFYTVYNLVKSGELPWLNDIIPALESQMKYRLLNSKCTLSMSGLANHIQLKSNLASSIYFTLSQPLIIKNKEDSSFPNFSGSAQHMLNLLDLCSYKFQNDNLYKYIKIINICSRLIYDVKQIHIEQFHNKYSALFNQYYQIKLDKLSKEYKDFVMENNMYYEYVPFDHVDNYENPEYSQKLSDEEKILYYNLSKLIKSENETTFNLDIDINNLDKFYKVPEKQPQSWKVYDYQIKPINVDICRSTMRPYTYMGNTHWKDSFDKYYNTKHIDIFSKSEERKPLGEVFSGSKYFAEFVSRFGIYPNINDLVLFSYNIVKNSQYAHTALPSTGFFESIINEYSFTKDISVIDFVKLYETSRNRDIRLNLEQNNSSNISSNIDFNKLNVDKVFNI